MKIYIDAEYKCHVANPDGEYKEIETSFFDGKCNQFIEGYRYIPQGETWVDADGEEYPGLAIIPWLLYEDLEKIQMQYEVEVQQKEIKNLTAKLEAAIESATMLEDCVIEMAEIVYA